MATLDATVVLAAGLTDWRPLVHRLHARFASRDFASGLEFVIDVGAAAEDANHHPDVRLTYTHVDVTLVSHDVGGITDRDLDLARTISRLADEHGFTAEPAVLTAVEIALNAVDRAAIAPFWSAVLTGDPGNVRGDEVTDPTGQVPLLWFQPTQRRDEVPPMCFHLDVWVPPDELDTRIATAIEAGGTLVDGSEKPSFVVLEDAEGNKACLCTVLERS